MGYRSQVVLAFKKETYREHEDALRENLKDCDEVSENELGYYFHWDSIKWYDGFADVKAIQDVLLLCDFEEYALVRIGEEDGDIEHEGDHAHFNVYVCRSFELPNIEELKKDHFFAINSVKFIKED